MCKKITSQDFWNDKLSLIIGKIGTFSNVYQGLFHIVAKKGGRIILGFSKDEEIKGDNIENIVEIGGGSVPHLKVNGICTADSFNHGITDEITIGDKVLTIKGGVITKVEDKK